MTWIQTASSVAFDLLKPTPDMVRMHDIALSLSRIPRFLGHTIHDMPFSVAQHSLLVAELMPEDCGAQDRLLALLHDAHEAYVGDHVLPLKVAIREYDRGIAKAYGSCNSSQANALESIKFNIDRAVRLAFGLPENLSGEQVRIIQQADMMALRLERDALMSEPPAEWVPLPEPPARLSGGVEFLLLPMASAHHAYTQFIGEFRRLMDRRHGLQA